MSQKDRKRRQRERQAAEAQRDFVQSRLEQDRQDYAAKWANDARRFAEKSAYAWMASFLTDYPVVLEVGVGDGTGTVELLRAGHAVIGIEENPACSRRAKETILKNGYRVECIERGAFVPKIAPQYHVAYTPVEAVFPDAGTALLVNGDVFNEPHLDRWLAQQRRIDALICWLMGTYPFRILNKDVTPRVGTDRVESATNYRILIEQTCIALAGRILKPNGIIQIVIRGKIPGAGNIASEDVLRTYNADANETGITFETTSFRPVDGFDVAGGIPVALDPNLDGAARSDGLPPALWSIIGRKIAPKSRP